MAFAQQPATAPDGPDTTLRSSIVVLDQERLLAETVLGAQISTTLENASRALAEENRRIEQELIDEERALTEARPSMEPEAFRAAATAFDKRVTEVREAQDRKARAITERHEEERRAFLDAAVPILGALMSDFGAFVILDQRQVFLSDDRINITDEAIARIDAAFGAHQQSTPEQDPAVPAPDATSGGEAPPAQ